jgi:hypothetical protein
MQSLLKKITLQRRNWQYDTIHRIIAIPQRLVTFYSNETPNQTYVMKKLFSFFAIIGIILASNCSRIPENNDPVIGIWSNIEVKSISQTQKSTNRQEWIFNDAYLGRYHTYTNGAMEELTDFKWEEEDGVYTISYPGIENKLNDVVTMIESQNESILKASDGHTLAIRE